MAVYDFEIDEVPVSLTGEAPPAILRTIHVGYNEPRTLVFDYVGEPILHAWAKLTVDGELRFVGQVKERRRTKTLNERSTYVAYDLADDLGTVDVSDTAGYPTLAVGLQAMDDAFTALYSTDLGEQVRALGLGGWFLGASSELLPKVTVRGTSFLDAVNAICQAVPGWAWLIDPDYAYSPPDHGPTGRLINTLDAEAYTLRLGEDLIIDHDLTETIRNRYSAVRIIGPGGETLVTTSAALTPAWNSALQTTWKIDDQGGATAAGADAAAARDVYRLYDFSAVAASVVREEPVFLVQQTAAGKYFSVRIAEIDFENGLVLAESPMLEPVPTSRAQGANVRVPGKAKPATAAHLVYKTASVYLPGIRYPETGYAGTAYSRFGLQRERIVYEPTNDTVTEDRAQRVLQLIGDVGLEGTIMLGGDVPSELWNLGKRINLASIYGETGYEDIATPLVELDHDFQARVTTLKVGAEAGGFAGEGTN